MDAMVWTERYTDDQKELWDKLLAIVSESKLPCRRSGEVISDLSEYIHKVGGCVDNLFSADEILTRYAKKKEKDNYSAVLLLGNTLP